MSRNGRRAAQRNRQLARHRVVLAKRLGREPTRVEVEAHRALVAAAKLCEGCPPAGYPTDETRCLPCPWRTT